MWYHTEKEHWLGWLSEYDGPGAYGRTGDQHRDARFAYNHIVNPYMLMYPIEAIPMRPELVEAAQVALKANAHSTLMRMSGAIGQMHQSGDGGTRRAVPAARPAFAQQAK
jgi:hypothetical protein